MTPVRLAGFCMLVLLTMGASTCVVVPKFQCEAPYQQIFMGTVGYGEQCPERLAYPHLLDDTAETQAYINQMVVGLGSIPETEINPQLYAALATGPPGGPERANFTNSAITLFTLGNFCDDRGCFPGPFGASVSAATSSHVEHYEPSTATDATHWRWIADTPLWYPATGGIEWLELFRDYGYGQGGPAWLTYLHTDPGGLCFQQWQVIPQCYSLDPTDPGLIPGELVVQ